MPAAPDDALSVPQSDVEVAPKDTTAPTRRVAVVTDAGSALPDDIAAQRGIEIAPMELVVDGVAIDHNGQSALDDFYKEILPGARTPPTSIAPKPKAWLDRFRAAFSVGESLLAVTVSGTLSVAFESARVAAELAEEEFPGRTIRVFDSRTAAGSEALIAIAAAKAAEGGAGLDAVEAKASEVRDGVRLVAFLDTLEYVWRGGRVPRIAVWATNLFGIKPVMEYANDRPNLVARPRTRARALNRLLSEMRRDVGSRRTHVTVMHAAAPDEAESLRERVAGEFDCAELIVCPFAPFMGAHTGPGVVGLAYWSESE